MKPTSAIVVSIFFLLTVHSLVELPADSGFGAAALSPTVSQSLPRGANHAAALDRFGGDSRLKSKVHNAGVTFFGRSTQLKRNLLIDRRAKFPTDGRLIGKLINPNYRRAESAAAPEKWFRIVSNTATAITTDERDGDLAQFAKTADPYQITGVFTLEKLGNRWWFIDPEGNVFFPRAVSKTDTWEPYSYIYGTFYKYDAVYLETRDGGFSGNLSERAEDPYPADVVNESGVTLRSVGDAIYIGSRRPFNVTYFRLSQLGVGGQVEWYYSSTEPRSPWVLLNGTGNPAAGAIRNADGSYNLDVGNYLGPASNGELVEHDPTANKIYW
jgi:hypothetical protein